MDDIKEKVQHLVKMYETRNPFSLARDLGIIVLFEKLGSIDGYYNKQLRMKQIHINEDLPEHMQRFTAAHELGHAILHPNTNTPFLRRHTLFSVGKLETEANKFAVELLIPDSDLTEYAEHYTVEQIARIYGYNSEIIALRTK